MYDKTWALARAEALYNPDERAERREVGVHEFGLGFVVWAEESRTGPTGLPASIGTACAVVDKDSGALSLWPPLPATMIAERYRR